jgi:hypothetical protein
MFEDGGYSSTAFEISPPSTLGTGVHQTNHPRDFLSRVRKKNIFYQEILTEVLTGVSYYGVLMV